jgi:hypothetical protein
MVGAVVRTGARGAAPSKFTLLEPLEGPSAEFTLVHLTVRGSAGTADSAEGAPSRAMMVSPSVADLLDGARSLIASPRQWAVAEFRRVVAETQLS